MGFDAIIANPIMGIDSLKNLTKSAHRYDKGIITLCHMSAPEAKLSYDMQVKIDTKMQLYQLFLELRIVRPTIKKSLPELITSSGLPPCVPTPGEKIFSFFFAF